MKPGLATANRLPLSGDYERNSTMAGRTLVLGVLGAHVLVAWGLMQADPVRQLVRERAPMRVDLIDAPRPPAPPAPPPPPAAPRVVKTPPPPPIIAAAATPSPAPPAFVMPLPPAEPSPPVVEAPAAPPAPPAPPAPKTIPATAVQYVDPPAPTYPPASRRLGESGRVLVRVEIDVQGRARQVQLSRSSGSTRLDEAALAAVREARFKPHTENGSPLVVWTTVPILFELES